MKILNKIITYNKWKYYLLIGMLVNEALAFLSQAVAFFINKSGISFWTSFWLEVGSFAIAAIFFALAFICYRQQFEPGKINKHFCFQWWYRAILLLISLGAVSKLPALLFQYVGYLSPLVAIISSGVAYLVLGVIFILTLIVFILDLQVSSYFVAVGYLLRKVFKKFKLFLATIGMLIWFAMGKTIIDIVFLILINILPNSFALLVVEMLLIAIINAVVLAKYMNYVSSVREVVYHEGAPARVIKSVTFKKVLAGVMTAGVVVFILLPKLEEQKNYEAVYVDEYIAELMEYAKKEAYYERPHEAIRIYVKVEEYLNALSAYIEGDEETVAQYMTTYNDDDFYWRLNYTLTNDAEMAREALIDSQSDTRLCHDILRHYKDTSTTKEEEDLIEDCMWICMSEGAFVDTTLKFHKDSLRKKTINDMKELYAENLMYNDLMLVLQSSALQGYVDETTAYKLLELANANADNMTYQLMAVMGASQYMKDGASHYGSIIECAKRLNTLLEEENRDMDSLVEEKLYLAQVVMNCADYKTALEILENVKFSGNVDVEDSIIRCHFELRDNEQVVTYIDELRENGSDRATMDYFAALSNLKLNDVDAALENGVMLAEKVKNGGEEREENNALLYSFAEYLCISDSYKSYIDYYYRVSSYTDEQLAILSKSPILDNYVKAMNALYSTGDYEAAINALDDLEAKESGLSRTYFLKGTIYFNIREYDKAIECFRNCIAIDEKNTTATYSLAVIYDIKGEYEKSAQLCEQILDIMPEVNHDKDWYGVSYHTRALYNALQSYIGGM